MDQLSSESKRMLAMGDQLGEGVVVTDLDSRILHANHCFLAMIDYDLDTLIGKRGYELFLPKEEWPQILEKNRARAKGESEKYEIQLTRKDGSRFWTAATATPLPNALGQVVGTTAVFTNIDQRKQMETNRALALDILTIPFEGGFFVEVARKLAETYEVEVAFIAECQGVDRVKTIAWWQSGNPGDNYSYDLQGTPCETVVGRNAAYYASQVDRLFPKDPNIHEQQIDSYIGIPLNDSGNPLGHFALMHNAPFPNRYQLLETLKMIASRIASEMERNRREALLEARNQRLKEEIQARKHAMSTINYFREEIGQEHNVDSVIGVSPAFREVLENIQLVSKTDASVLVTGETGTGKELVARLIHEQGPRSGKSLIKVNCAALPGDLIEAELFGHEKGAFTNAQARRKGRFELAHGGSLFLDEIGELSLSAQVKLLRVLQEKEIERVGGNETIAVDFRLIAATNRDLEAMVGQGTFRNDLFYRLNVFPIPLPPLRERGNDIPLLAAHFLNKFSRDLGKRFDGIHPNALHHLTTHNWPGNIRELENLIHRAAILSNGPLLEVPLSAGYVTGTGTSLEEVEREHIKSVLGQTAGRIEGEGGAAEILGMNPSTLRSRLKKLGINR